MDDKTQALYDKAKTILNTLTEYGMIEVTLSDRTCLFDYEDMEAIITDLDITRQEEMETELRSLAKSIIPRAAISRGFTMTLYPNDRKIECYYNYKGFDIEAKKYYNK